MKRTHFHTLTMHIHLIALCALACLQTCIASQGGDPKNAIAVQPLGVFFLRTSIEYERLVSKSSVPVTIAGRFNMTADGFNDMWYSHFSSVQGKANSWSGLGVSGRVYLERDRMDAFYLGLNLDYYAGSVEDLYYFGENGKFTGHFFTLGFETGRKYTFAKSGNGLFIMPSAGFMFYLAKEVPYNFKEYFYFIGLGVGFQF